MKKPILILGNSDESKAAEELLIKNSIKVDNFFSSFTYFYLFKFEDILFKTIFNNLDSGGKYSFNITNFLEYFNFNEIKYNNFYFKLIEGFNEFLIKEGVTEGIGEYKMVTNYKTVTDKLHEIGFSKVNIGIQKLNLYPSQMLDFMIDNFYKYGSCISWSSTINKMNINKKMDILKRGKNYIKNNIDTEYPNIINIVAIK